MKSVVHELSRLNSATETQGSGLCKNAQMLSLLRNIVTVTPKASDTTDNVRTFSAYLVMLPQLFIIYYQYCPPSS
jgi:hypothetical protein